METTTKKPSAKANSVRASVNEKQLLATMKHLFKSNYSFLGELMQNARRAGASLVRFEFDPEAKTLLVQDNGCGIEDFGKLIDLCTSGWDEEIQIADNPFGMGFFSVFFACEHITVRSRGLKLTASHEDIMVKRLLEVVPDDAPVNTGVILELHGLKQELLGQHQYYKEASADKIEHYELYRQLRKFSMGFPIEVQCNGKSLPRPHAQSALKGEETAYGFVHMAHMHDEKLAFCLSDCLNKTALYLQGLPINGRQTDGIHNVVHLSSAKFTPQMPDRVYLREADAALIELGLVMRGKICEFLSRQKKTLSPVEFISKHWDNCISFGVSHLLNDIPFAPNKVFGVQSQLTYRSEERWRRYLNAANIVSLDDITDGKIKAWRSVPEDIDDSGYWAVLQLIMARENILSLDTQGLNAEHWLIKRTPSCNDFKVTVTPVGDTQKRASYDLDSYNCDIHLVEGVAVTITSDVDAEFKLEHLIDNDFVVVDESQEEDQNGYDHDVVVFAMKSGKYDGSPVKLFSSFEDEHDRYDESWEDNAAQQWMSIINSLLGLSLAKNIKLGINQMQITIAEQQIGHMALVRPSKIWNEREYFEGLRLHVVDLESPDVWNKLSELIAARPGLDGGAIKAAFIEAIGGVGQIGGPESTKS
jgi:hypothetical protein